MSLGSVEFTKKASGASADLISGAVFGLFDDETQAKVAAGSPVVALSVGVPDVGLGLVQRVSPDGVGNVSFGDVSVGDYWVVELKSPDGFVRNVQVHPVIIGKGVNSFTPVFGEIGKFVNSLGSLRFTNIGKSLDCVSFPSLPGGRFAIFDNEENARIVAENPSSEESLRILAMLNTSRIVI